MRRETLRRVLALPIVTVSDCRELVVAYLERQNGIRRQRRCLIVRHRAGLLLYALTPSSRLSIVALPSSGPRAALGALVRECRRWTSETILGLDS